MDASLFHGSLVSSNRILYTPSSFAKISLIHLQEIGSLHAQKPHTSKRENLSSYLFFVVVSGSGTLEYNSVTYKINTNDCVFIDCRRPYAHTTSNNLWKLCWAHFYGPTMINIYEKYIERGGLPVFHPENITPYIELYSRLYKVATSGDYVKDMMINENLTSLLTLIMKENWHPEQTRRSSPKKQNLLAVKDYLDANCNDKISLDSLAEQFFINKFYLTRIFKEQFGVSINTYLLQIRITHAKQLLRFTNKTLEVISAECGMGDPTYFSRIFRRIEGITPSEFKKMW